MPTIDFDVSPKQSFIHGFVKGVASPVALFGSHARQKTLAPIMPVMYQSESTSNAIRRDWMMVGSAIHKAISEHQGQENNPSN